MGPVYLHFSPVQLRPLGTAAHWAPLPTGSLQAAILECVAVPSSGSFPTRAEPRLLCWQGGFFTTSTS